MEKTAKQQAIELIQQLPDQASLDTILAELHFVARIERGIMQMERGEVVSHEEVKESLREWLASHGAAQVQGVRRAGARTRSQRCSHDASAG